MPNLLIKSEERCSNVLVYIKTCKLIRYYARDSNLSGFFPASIGPNLTLGNSRFWPGWISYITELSTLNFGLSKHGVPIIDELVVVFLQR